MFDWIKFAHVLNGAETWPGSVIRMGLRPGPFRWARTVRPGAVVGRWGMCLVGHARCTGAPQGALCHVIPVSQPPQLVWATVRAVHIIQMGTFNRKCQRVGHLRYSPDTNTSQASSCFSDFYIMQVILALYLFFSYSLNFVFKTDYEA